MFCVNILTFSRYILFNSFDDRLTLFCWFMTFAHWLTLLRLTHLCKLDITSGFFSWGGCVIGGSSEG